MDRAELEQYRLLSFPIYYGRLLLNTWKLDSVQLFVSLVGTGVIFIGIARFGRFLWNYLLRPSSLPKYCHSETGSWALVTGASDGIGRAFADELLGEGFNILIHGRNEEKLKGIQKAMKLRWPRRAVEYVVADASKTDGPELRVVEKVKTLPGRLTILVNNVGGISTRPIFQTLESSSKSDLENCLAINTAFPTYLTSALLPELKKNSPALIINAGSFAGAMGMPMLAAYSGTKAYVMNWTHALKAEMNAEKVDIEVMGVIIGNTLSAGNQSSMGFGTITSAQCARGSLGKVGSGETLTYAHWTHEAMFTIMSIFPESLVMPMMAGEMKKRFDDERKGK